MPKAKVYIETTIVSYLTALPSRDVVRKHIANAATRGIIEETCRGAGYEPPTICTPEELTED